jgi:hypothetical protein
MNAPDDEHVVLEFDLAQRLGYQTVVRGIDLTRLQRASKGSGQSTRGRRHNIIQGCGVRLQNRLGNLIVFSDCAVDAEDHRQRFCGQIRLANRTLHPFDSDLGTIDDCRHPTSFTILIAYRRRKVALKLAAHRLGGGAPKKSPMSGLGLS